MNTRIWSTVWTFCHQFNLNPFLSFGDIKNNPRNSLFYNINHYKLYVADNSCCNQWNWILILTPCRLLNIKTIYIQNIFKTFFVFVCLFWFLKLVFVWKHNSYIHIHLPIHKPIHYQQEIKEYSNPQCSRTLNRLEIISYTAFIMATCLNHGSTNYIFFFNICIQNFFKEYIYIYF